MSKIIINAIIILVLIFYLCGITFSFPPVRIKFTHGYMAIGVILIIVGILLIYYQGQLNSNHE